MGNCHIKSFDVFFCKYRSGELGAYPDIELALGIDPNIGSWQWSKLVI